MSGYRGPRKNTPPSEYPRFNDPRWMNPQQHYYSQSSSHGRSWSSDGWSPQWQAVPPNNGWTPAPYHSSNHQRIGESYEQFQGRFPNAYNSPNTHFSERSLAHLNQTPLNELARGNHSVREVSVVPRASSSNRQPSPSLGRTQTVNSVNSQSTRSVGAANTQVPVSSAQNSVSKAQNSATVSQKQPAVTSTPSTFMPPNDDLRNKVKASLKLIAEAKDFTSTSKTTSVQKETETSSSSQQQGDSRKQTNSSPATLSPSTSSNRNFVRPSTVPQRRPSQTSTSTTSSGDKEGSSTLSNGVASQKSSSEATTSSEQGGRIRRASNSSVGDGASKESDQLTSATKDQLNRFIRSMDNQQRRQLVEQPRATISQSMLNTLMQESQTARARQLSSLRFRVNSTELDLSSKTDGHVVLSEELMEQIKEMLASEDNSDTQSTSSNVEKEKQVEKSADAQLERSKDVEKDKTKESQSEKPKGKPVVTLDDEEIQVLEPPPKPKPLCIDLDCDDQPVISTPEPPAPKPKNDAPVANNQSSVALKDIQTEVAPNPVAPSVTGTATLSRPGPVAPLGSGTATPSRPSPVAASVTGTATSSRPSPVAASVTGTATLSRPTPISNTPSTSSKNHQQKSTANPNLKTLVNQQQFKKAKKKNPNKSQLNQAAKQHQQATKNSSVSAQQSTTKSSTPASISTPVGAAIKLTNQVVLTPARSIASVQTPQSTVTLTSTSIQPPKTIVTPTSAAIQTNKSTPTSVIIQPPKSTPTSASIQQPKSNVAMIRGPIQPLMSIPISASIQPPISTAIPAGASTQLPRSTSTPTSASIQPPKSTSTNAPIQQPRSNVVINRGPIQPLMSIPISTIRASIQPPISTATETGASIQQPKTTTNASIQPLNPIPTISSIQTSTPTATLTDTKGKEVTGASTGTLASISLSHTSATNVNPLAPSVARPVSYIGTETLPTSNTDNIQFVVPQIPVTRPPVLYSVPPPSSGQPRLVGPPSAGHHGALPHPVGTHPVGPQTTQPFCPVTPQPTGLQSARPHIPDARLAEFQTTVADSPPAPSTISSTEGPSPSLSLPPLVVVHSVGATFHVPPSVVAMSAAPPPAVSIPVAPPPLVSIPVVAPQVVTTQVVAPPIVASSVTTPLVVTSPVISRPVDVPSVVPTVFSSVQNLPSEPPQVTPVPVALTTETTTQTREVVLLARDEFPEKASAQSDSALSEMLVKLQSEEQMGKDRICLIDRTIEDLQKERKSLTERVLTLKQKQFDLLRSAFSTGSFPDQPKNQPQSTDKQEVSVVLEKEVDTSKNESSQKKTSDLPVPVRPSTSTVASTQLLNLMQQLEENGIQVAIDELDFKPPLVPSLDVQKTSNDSSPSTNLKRKRSADEDSTVPKRKTSSLSSSPQSFSGKVLEQQSKTPSSVGRSSASAVASSSPSVSSSPMLPRIVSSYSISTIADSICQANYPGLDSGSENTKNTSSTSRSSEATHNPFAQKGPSNSSRPNLVATVPENNRIPTSQSKSKSGETRNEVGQHRATGPKDNAAVGSKPSGKRSSTSGTDATPKTKDSVTSNALATSANLSTPPSSPSTSSSRLHQLQKHSSCIRCVFVKGPCIFSFSEDFALHVYDIKTGQLSMRILGHSEPVTWLHALSVDSRNSCQHAKSTSEYLSLLNLVTGSEDHYIREFSMETGDLTFEKKCKFALTCVDEHKSECKLYIGSRGGHIFMYSPKKRSLKEAPFKVETDVVCLKLIRFGDQRAITVSPKHSDSIIFRLQDGSVLCKVSNNHSGRLVNSIAAFSHYVYFCWSDCTISTFDTKSQRPFSHTLRLPSPAVGSYHDGKQFLVLGCGDGVIRVLNTTAKSDNRFVPLPGPNMRTLSCMMISENRIVGGSTDGEISHRKLPNLEKIIQRA